MIKRILLLLSVLLIGGAFATTLELQSMSLGGSDSKTRTFLNKANVNFFEEIGDNQLSGDFRLLHDFHDRNNVDTDLIINDLYIKMPVVSVGTFGFGRKVDIWGKTDETNPTDFFTREDFRYFILFDKAERAKGSTFLTFNREFDSFNIAFVLNLEHNRSDLPESGGAWDTWQQRLVSESASLHLSENDNKKWKGEATYASKLSTTFYDFDLDFVVGYFEHHTPSYQVLLSQTGITLKEEYLNYVGAGLSLSKEIGENILHMEVSYRDRVGLIFEDLSKHIYKNDLLFTVGLDGNTENNIIWNVQYNVNKVFTDAKLLSETYSDYIQAKAQKSFMDETLTFETRAAVQLVSSNGYFIKPQITKTFFDDLSLSFGGFLFGGNSRRLFGQYNDRDSVFAQIGYVTHWE